MTNTTGKINLLGLTQPEMEQFFESIGEKRFRAGQVMKWIHHFGVDDFAAMTNVGKALREKLEASAEIRGPEVVSENISADGTRKWVVRVASGSCVETVYIPQNGRGTLCVSSQVGCTLNCRFCHTGTTRPPFIMRPVRRSAGSGGSTRPGFRNEGRQTWRRSAKCPCRFRPGGRCRRDRGPP